MDGKCEQYTIICPAENIERTSPDSVKSTMSTQNALPLVTTDKCTLNEEMTDNQEYMINDINSNPNLNYRNDDHEEAPLSIKHFDTSSDKDILIDCIVIRKLKAPINNAPSNITTDANLNYDLKHSITYDSSEGSDECDIGHKRSRRERLICSGHINKHLIDSVHDNNLHQLLVLKDYNQQRIDMPKQELITSDHQQLADANESSERPTYFEKSYADLIAMAIESSDNNAMTLSEIYNWFVDNVPQFQNRNDKKSSISWKNSIRHNLSTYRKFIKVKLNKISDRKSFWAIDYNVTDNPKIEETCLKQRKRDFNCAGCLELQRTVIDSSSQRNIAKMMVSQNLCPSAKESQRNVQSCCSSSPLYNEIKEYPSLKDLHASENDNDRRCHEHMFCDITVNHQVTPKKDNFSKQTYILDPQDILLLPICKVHLYNLLNHVKVHKHENIDIILNNSGDYYNDMHKMQQYPASIQSPLATKTPLMQQINFASQQSICCCPPTCKRTKIDDPHSTTKDQGNIMDYDGTHRRNLANVHTEQYYSHQQRRRTSAKNISMQKFEHMRKSIHQNISSASINLESVLNKSIQDDTIINGPNFAYSILTNNLNSISSINDISRDNYCGSMSHKIAHSVSKLPVKHSKREDYLNRSTSIAAILSCDKYTIFKCPYLKCLHSKQQFQCFG
ncbi:hypothetical protein GJ496_008680 [Pomphorhynchus laevis]|nr:hypothetical protein GJ496_008680 [Pomphorhynchus laevis]